MRYARFFSGELSLAGEQRSLFDGLDTLTEPPLPGRWPFVRGGDALRDVNAGWEVAEAFPAAGPVTDGIAAVLSGVGRRGDRAGVAGRRIRCRAVGSRRLLEGVYLELAPVMVDAGADYVAAADAVLALVAGLDAGTRAQLSIDLGADQLTAPLNGRPARAWTGGRLRRRCMRDHH